jgi:hypothetical protein
MMLLLMILVLVMALLMMSHQLEHLPKDTMAPMATKSSRSNCEDVGCFPIDCIGPQQNKPSLALLQKHRTFGAALGSLAILGE